MPPQVGSLQAKLANDPLRQLVAQRTRKKQLDITEGIRKSHLLMNESESRAVDELIAEAKQEERCNEINTRAVAYVRQQTIKRRQ